MAHHQSAKKRIRQIAKRRLENRYYGKTARNLIRKVQATTDKKEAQELAPQAISKVDKLVKRGTIHRNKASHLKSQIMKHVNALS